MSFPKISIIYPDDSHETFNLTPAAKVRWERQFGVPFMSMLIPAQVAAEKGEDPFGALVLEHVLFLGWTTKYPKPGEGVPEFDDWCETVLRVELGDREAEPSEDEGDATVPLDRSA